MPNQYPAALSSFATMSNTDLNQYGRFVDYMLISCQPQDLEYWDHAAAALNIEILGRQAAYLLKRLPYGLTVGN